MFQYSEESDLNKSERFRSRKNDPSRWSEIEVLNTLKDLFKSIEGLIRSGKVQIGSKAEEIIVLGGLR